MLDAGEGSGQLISLYRRCAISLSARSRVAGISFFIMLAITALSGRSLAHEVWIEPATPGLSPGEGLVADLRIGDMFKGDHLIYIPQQTERLLVLTQTGSFDLAPKIGSRPVVVVPPEQLDGVAGSVVAIYESANSYAHYQTAEKFFRFAEKKGMADVRQAHAGRQLPESGFVERYRRFAKASVSIGDAARSGAYQVNDRAVGMEVEFVLMAMTPLSDGATAFDIQLLYQGRALPDALVTLFARAPDGTVTPSRFVTGGTGTIGVRAEAGYRYLLDHVTVREADPSRDRNRPVWESLWASLTFAGPAS